MRTTPPRARTALAGIVVLAVGFLTATCSDDIISPPDQLELGTWGGDDAGVIATDSLTHVHVGCTFGDLPGPIALDSEGRFTVDGSYMLHAYPVAVGPPMPAQFSGLVRGRTLTLAIAVNDTIAGEIVALGPVEVIYGRTPGMTQCPICVVPGVAVSGVE